MEEKVTGLHNGLWHVEGRGIKGDSGISPLSNWANGGAVYGAQENGEDRFGRQPESVVLFPSVRGELALAHPS